MNKGELKHKLRELKKIEKNIRYSNCVTANDDQLLWNKYFNTKDEKNAEIKYNMSLLLSMDHEERKNVFERYFFDIYFFIFKQGGISLSGIYDPNLLSFMGLPPSSTIDEIKAKFRQLVKKYHPDHGGDSEKMVELLDAYNELIGNK